MRLVKISKNPASPMLQVDIPEGSGHWAFCSQQVLDYAQKTIQEGDEVELTYTFNNGRCDITFIKKVGGSQQQTGFQCTDCGAPLKDGKYKKCYNCNQSKNTPPASNFKCEDCGVALKDGKYKKCYTCNQKKPKQTTSRDTGESIERQNCNNATSRALIALQGQVDLNNIVSVIDTLWNAFYAKLKK